MNDSRRFQALGQLASAIAVGLGLAPGGAEATKPQTVSPDAAPRAWLAYATQASQRMAARLSADDPVAGRLRDYLNQLPGAEGADGVTLKLAVWVDARGAITRIDFAPFVHPQPSDDLRALLVGLDLSVPPKGMLLPIRLGVTLKPAQAPAAWTHREWPGRPIVRVSFDMGIDKEYPDDPALVSAQALPSPSRSLPGGS